MGQARINTIVIEPDNGAVIVNFIGNGWSTQWSKRCSNIEEAFTAIRDELRARPDNVVDFGSRNA